MLKRVPQPPVNPARRNPERHDFWTGFAVGGVGLVLLVCGARHLTGVETTDGGTARETQLIKAFSAGGLQFPQQVVSPLPPKDADPAALDRWIRRNSEYARPTWKVRVDAAAAAPCPT
jgi:hypothetical protein